MKRIYILVVLFTAALSANATVTLQRPIPDVIIPEGTQGWQADDLSQVFSTNAGPITYTLARLAPGVYPQLAGNLLLLGTSAYYLGTSHIVVTATDNNSTLRDTFRVDVVPSSGSCDILEVPVSVLNFDPRLATYNNQPIHQAMGWKDPYQISEGYIEKIAIASYGYIRYRINYWQDLDVFPVKADGFQYTETTYLDCWINGNNCHQPDEVDYEGIIAQYDQDTLVNRHLIDEMWFFGGPYFGYWESSMAGPGSFFINGGVYPSVPTNRAFAIMGFSYERDTAQMVHDLCHRTESTMERIYGGWDLLNPVTNWDYFTQNTTQSNGPAAVGTCHWPPNAASSYDYGNMTVVQSTAADWMNFPVLTGATGPVSAATWGGGPDYELGYLVWWFEHLPHAPGINADGRLNNWWNYIFDFNNYTWNGVSLNQSPTLAVPFPDIGLAQGFGTYYAGRASVAFPDPDLAQPTYLAWSLTAGVSAAVVRDSVFVYETGSLPGTAYIVVAACDRQFTVTDTFEIQLTPNGIAEQEADPFRLYPNPAGDQITVSSPDMITQLIVTDLAGRTVLRMEPRRQQAEVQLGDLPAGVYLVRVQTVNGWASRKMVRK
jgi:hypothetical protein